MKCIDQVSIFHTFYYIWYLSFFNVFLTIKQNLVTNYLQDIFSHTFLVIRSYFIFK